MNIRIKDIPFFYSCGEKTVVETSMISFVLSNRFWLPHCIPLALLKYNSVKVIWWFFFNFFYKLIKFSIPVLLLRSFKAQLVIKIFCWNFCIAPIIASGAFYWIHSNFFFMKRSSIGLVINDICIVRVSFFKRPILLFMILWARDSEVSKDALLFSQFFRRMNL